ncbi:hypothetical protein ACH3WN_21690 [Streptomyces albogriseolus]
MPFAGSLARAPPGEGHTERAGTAYRARQGWMDGWYELAPDRAAR